MGDAVRPLLHGAWISAALIGACAVALAVLPHFGYATPFGMPDHVHVYSRDYIQPSGCTAPYKRDLPLTRVGSVHGILTGSKPIYRPNHMPRGLDPVYVYVRAGCLRAYGLSGGP